MQKLRTTFTRQKPIAILSRLICLISCVTCPTFGHAHTHIGRNPDSVWGNTDDNQLWIFASPQQPQWDTIPMEPTGDFINGKQLYVAELDCWHSAHPPTGAFQLGGSTQGLVPDWRINLKRIAYSDDSNFWIEEEASGLEILTQNGDTYFFGTPMWFADMYNENGQLGAYGFHVHTEFLAIADGPGRIFSATFTALDTGTTRFLESVPYTLNFLTVPDPGITALLALGAVWLRRYRSQYTQA